MSLAPDPSEQIARARGDLRMGVPIVIIDGPLGSWFKRQKRSLQNALRMPAHCQVTQS